MLYLCLGQNGSQGANTIVLHVDRTLQHTLIVPDGAQDFDAILGGVDP
jgi:hypothetical protein